MIVVDVSAIIPYILFKDEMVEKVILDADRIFSPELYVPECGNTILKYFNSKLINNEEATVFLQTSIDLIDIFFSMHECSDDVFTLSYKENLSYYDAQYLFLAIKLNTKLLSRDKNLNEIAKKYNLSYT